MPMPHTFHNNQRMSQFLSQIFVRFGDVLLLTTC